jgi:uncharacterized protein YcbK (DUF882 family)
MPNPRKGLRAAVLLSAGAAFALLSVNTTQDAVANGGTRSLTIYHAHTKEQETVTFKSFGSFNSAGLQKLNWMLRDWRQDEPTRMDPQLFDILWEVYRASGSSGPIHVVSAYRSPGTNAMLARRSRGVAKNSQHMSGKAMDFNLPDVSMARVRDIGLRLQTGGVGYYPRSNNPWVHLDTGGVRHWPKVSRDHLVRLFPDERTVHIPSDGKPLAGFETARAVIEARGGSVSSGYIEIAEGRATGKTLFQILFGGGEGDDEGDIAPRGKGRTAVAARQKRGTQIAALAPEPAAEGNALAFFSQPNASTSVASRQEAPALRPSRPTRPTPLPEPTPAPAPVPVPEVKREEPRPAEPKPADPKPAEPKPIEVAALQPRTATPPPGVRTDADDAADGKRVMVQLPPRRPGNLAALVAAASGPALVTVPLPPQRPAVLLASATDDAPPAAARTGTVSQTASIGLRTDPLPPSVLSYAPQTAPSPGRIVPAAPVSAPATPVAAAARPTPQQPAADSKDRKALDNLISHVAAASSAGRVAPVAPPTVSAVTGGRTVTGRFDGTGSASQADGGFSGSAIRPLGQGFRQ